MVHDLGLDDATVEQLLAGDVPAEIAADIADAPELNSPDPLQLAALGAFVAGVRNLSNTAVPPPSAELAALLGGATVTPIGRGSRHRRAVIAALSLTVTGSFVGAAAAEVLPPAVQRPVVAFVNTFTPIELHRPAPASPPVRPAPASTPPVSVRPAATGQQRVLSPAAARVTTPSATTPQSTAPVAAAAAPTIPAPPTTVGPIVAPPAPAAPQATPPVAALPPVPAEPDDGAGRSRTTLPGRPKDTKDTKDTKDGVAPQATVPVIAVPRPDDQETPSPGRRKSAASARTAKVARSKGTKTPKAPMATQPAPVASAPALPAPIEVEGEGKHPDKDVEGSDHGRSGNAKSGKASDQPDQSSGRSSASDVQKDESQASPAPESAPGHGESEKPASQQQSDAPGKHAGR